jgi:hypothetical protein
MEIEQILGLVGGPGESEGDETVTEEFFVTYKGRSYMHAKWVQEAEILAGGLPAKQKLQRFMKKAPVPCEDKDEELFNPDFLVVDRVIAARPCATTTTANANKKTKVPVEKLEYLVKWCALPYSSATWELEQDFEDEKAIARFEACSQPPVQA